MLYIFQHPDCLIPYWHGGWLRFTRLARLLYPAYPEQAEEDKITRLCLKRPNREPVHFEGESRTTPTAIPPRVGQELSPVVRELIAAFFGKSVRLPTHHTITLNDALNDYAELYDDRLFVNVSYGLSGHPPDAETNRRLFATALFVDRREDTFSQLDSYAYDPAWLKPCLEEMTLPMWQGLGQQYGFTEMSNVYLGFGDFYCDIIAPVHVHYIYERMLIQALFYHASLRHYASHIANVTGELVANPRASAQPLREEFIRFTNQYWFHDITPQRQGREIFRRQQEALGLEREYAFIKDEIERTDEVTEALFNHRLQELGNRITVLGLAVAVFALWPVSLTFLKDFEGKESIRRTLQKLGWFEYLPDHLFLWAVGLPLLILLLIIAGFWSVRCLGRRRKAD